MIGNPKYPDSPDGNCEDSDSMHNCCYPTSCIHDCGDKCHPNGLSYDCGGCGSCPRRGDCVTHPDAEPTDAQNPYAMPYDDALAGHLRNAN